MIRINHKPTFPQTPKGKRALNVNVYGNIVAYVAGRRFWEFGVNDTSNTRDAERWLKGASLAVALGYEEPAEPLEGIHPLRISNAEAKVGFVALMAARSQALRITSDADRGMTRVEILRAIESLLLKLEGPARAAMNADEASR